MIFKIENQNKKLVYSAIILITYILLCWLQGNSLVAFILTLNIFYFSREAFFRQLFTKKETMIHAKIETSDPHEFFSEKESEILPSFIKEKNKNMCLEKSTDKENISIIKDPEIPKPVSYYTQNTDERFIEALQTAEKLVDQKIDILKEKYTFRNQKEKQNKNEVKILQNLNTLPDKFEQKHFWGEWLPSGVNEKLTLQGVWCEKCSKAYIILETAFEVNKRESYLEVISRHEVGSEKHTNTAKMTLESFEILSKPILTIEKTKEVEA